MAKNANQNSDTVLVALAEMQKELVELRHIKDEYLKIVAENEQLKAKINNLEKELESLKSNNNKKDPPHWVKKNTEKKVTGERKKRHGGFSRKCSETPNEEIKHYLDYCPDCNHKLTGGWEESRKEQIVFPEALIKYLLHLSYSRKCGVCGRICTGKPDPNEYGIVGRHRIDANGMSLISYLATVCRIPLETIRQILFYLYKIKISVGEITNILHSVAARGKAEYEKLRDEIRGSPYVHMDETGFREKGQNGYVWVAVTDWVRYYMRDKSRGGVIPKLILGDEYSGVIICDGYGGYNKICCLLQRCWVHILRNGKELLKKNPDNTELEAWFKGIHEIYKSACERKNEAEYSDIPEYRREKIRLEYEERIMEHVSKMSSSSIKAVCTYADFFRKHQPELFVFMQYIEVISENNPAERAIRPLVISRKISGGTRSEKGTETKMILVSLFETLKLRGIDQITAIKRMLLGQPLFN